MRHSFRITALLLAAGVVVLAAGCGGGTTAAPATGTQPVDCHAYADLGARIGIWMQGPSGLASFRTAERELEARADTAPPEIKGDLRTFAAAFTSYLQGVAESGYTPGSPTPPTAAQRAALRRAEKAFDTTEFNQAWRHFATWRKQNCK